MRGTRKGGTYVGPTDNTKSNVIVSTAQELEIYSATVEGEKRKVINRQNKKS